MESTIFLHLKITGSILIFLSLIHVVFPRYFNWKEELKHLSLINQQLMKVHTFFIALVVFLIGVLCLYSTNELIETNLGKSVSIGLGIFWFMRLITQFIGYTSEVWKGKKFETVVHVCFSFLWLYFTLVFGMNVFYTA